MALRLKRVESPPDERDSASPKGSQGPLSCPSCSTVMQKVSITPGEQIRCDELESLLTSLAGGGDRQSMYALGTFYKLHREPDKAGYWFGKLKLFPEFEFEDLSDTDDDPK